MTTATWGPPPTREHTFSTGRTAELREHVNVYEAARGSVLGLALIGHLEQAARGELSDGDVAIEVMAAIVRGMWAKPEVMPDGDEREPVPDERVPLSWLRTEEVNETAELFMASFEDAARFRGESAGTGDGARGEGVGRSAKPAPRARARKRAGVDGGPTPRGAAR